MEISNYSINIEKAIYAINKNNYKNVALQIPEGLKQKSIKIINSIEKKTNCNILLFADPCFGSCDIPNFEISQLNIDLLIHIGHTKIPNLEENNFPIIYLNAISKIDISTIIQKSIPFLIGKKIGIVTTAQHLIYLNKIKKILKNNNFIPISSKGDDRISEEGQILGCNYSSASLINNKVESYLFVGSGFFHPIGLLLNSKKPVIAADPYSNEIKKEELEVLKDKILKQRYGAITISKKAKNYGILIGIKSGQRRYNLALKIKKLLNKYNKKNYFILLNHFSPNYFESISNIDCYISTSCPRIAIDDYILYKKPIITPIELEIVLDQRNWNDYKFDQIF